LDFQGPFVYWGCVFQIIFAPELPGDESLSQKHPGGFYSGAMPITSNIGELSFYFRSLHLFTGQKQVRQAFRTCASSVTVCHYFEI